MSESPAGPGYAAQAIRRGSPGAAVSAEEKTREVSLAMPSRGAASSPAAKGSRSYCRCGWSVGWMSQSTGNVIVRLAPSARHLIIQPYIVHARKREGRKSVTPCRPDGNAHFLPALRKRRACLDSGRRRAGANSRTGANRIDSAAPTRKSASGGSNSSIVDRLCRRIMPRKWGRGPGGAAPCRRRM